MAPPKKSRPKRFSYTEDDLTAACLAVKEGKKGLREAARMHGVPHSTLKDRLKGRRPIKEVRRTVITADEERRLVDWIIESARRGFGRTARHVQVAVQAILKDRRAVTVFKDNLPGRTWISLFMQRHPEISLRQPQGLGSQRAAVTHEKLMAWFATAKKEIDAAGGDVLNHPERIFNCDESGFQLGGGICSSKVLAAKYDSHVYQITTDTHTQMTVLACGSASGRMLYPLVIYPGQRFHFEPLEHFKEAHFARSNNGWIDSQIFADWLRDAFIPEVADVPKPIVLFADGHKTHLTMTVSELCRDNGIILYQLPSHSSHVIQPLDLTTFKFLKQVWREEVIKFQEENGFVLGKKDFSKVFRLAWERGIKRDTVISGFRAAGLYPWSPEHINTSKLAPSRLYTTTSSPSLHARPDDSSQPSLHAPPDDSSPPSPYAPPDDSSQPSLHAPPDDSSPPSPYAPPDDSSQPSLHAPPDDSSQPSLHAPPDDSLQPSLHAPPDDSSQPSLHAPPDDSSQPSPYAPPDDSSPPSPHVPPYDSLPPSPHAPPHDLSPPSPHVPPPSSSSSDCQMIDQTPSGQLFDMILSLAAELGHSGLTRMKSVRMLQTSAESPEEDLFCKLYNQLSSSLKNPECASVSVSSPRTFDNLPLPSQWVQKRKARTILQPPKMVSSEAFRQFVIDTENKKRKIEEDKEKKKREREEKKKKTEEEKEKKKMEMEKKRLEREEKRIEKEKERKSKQKAKKVKPVVVAHVEVDDGSDSDVHSITSSKCVDHNSDIEIPLINDNLCFVCIGEKDNVFSDWIGCDCGRWYHIGCLDDDSIAGKSMSDIEKIVYVCAICKS